MASGKANASARAGPQDDQGPGGDSAREAVARQAQMVDTGTAHVGFRGIIRPATQSPEPISISTTPSAE